MAMRNFWVEGDIDGRETKVAGGPRRKEDGMSVTIYQRDNGSKITAVTIRCLVNYKGELVTIVKDCDGKEVIKHITER